MDEGSEQVSIRPLDASSELEVALVATRMRATLAEVLGAERAEAMYTIDWLRDRVRWHLDPTRCRGQVLVAELDRAIVGHSIVREERESRAFGLFSTTYVLPEARRRGTANALVVAGEAWLRGLGLRAFATDTDAHNRPLIRLFERHGYTIVHADPDKQMVRLWKDDP